MTDAPAATTSPDNRAVRILAIPGSLRTDSFNRRILRAATDLAPPAVQIELFEALATIPLFNEDLETDGEAIGAVNALRQEVAHADGLLISTPEYNHSMPGVLKNLIDWLSIGGSTSVLNGKPVAVVGVTSGPWGTRLAQAAARQVLYATGSLVLPAPAVFIRNAVDLFDSSGTLVDDRTRATLGRLLHAFQAWIRQVAPTGAGTPAAIAR